MIRRGPRRLRLSHGASSGDRGVLCFWCHLPAPDSPYRSPIPDVIGGRYVVCSPHCPQRPDGAHVYPDWAGWVNYGKDAS